MGDNGKVLMIIIAFSYQLFFILAKVSFNTLVNERKEYIQETQHTQQTAKQTRLTQKQTFI